MDENDLRRDADYEWCLRQPEMYQQFGDQVVVVCNRTVLGHGSDHLEALENVMIQLDQIPIESRPRREDMVFVAMPEYSSSPQMFRRREP